MGIHEDAFKGVLVSVAGYTSPETNSIGTIDVEGESMRVTPLAAACYGGHPHVVKLLLDNGALPNQDVDRRTPFYFTFSGNTLSKTQSTIVDELIKAKANVNLKGATPRSLAKTRGVEKLLNPDEDADAMSKQEMVDLVVGLVQVVVAYANKLTDTGTVIGGVVKQVYDMSGIERPEIVKDFTRPITSVAELPTIIADYARQKNLSAFFPKEDGAFLEELAKKAAALSNDSSTDLGNPENIGRLTVLSLYEPVLFLDDSGSMTATDPGQSMTRFQLLGELVKRIASIAAKIVPDSLAGVELRFINSTYAKRHDQQGVLNAVKEIKPWGGTSIGTRLREKVLKPIVYDQIAKKSDTNPIPLKRPVLVCIITDGAPNKEDSREMQNEILQCRNKLRAADFEDDAVMFCISQIGQATEATEFLDELRKDTQIEQTIYCSTDRLHDIFKDMKAKEKLLEVWLLKLLTKALVERDAE